MGKLSPSGETLFRTLIAAKNAPFLGSPRPSSRGADFYPKFGQSSAVISSRKGSILEAHGLPGIFEKFWEILGNLSPSVETLFRTLIGGKNAPFPAPLRPSSRGPDFYPKFGRSPSAISSKERGHFGDTWITRDFPKILEKSPRRLKKSRGETGAKRRKGGFQIDRLCTYN